MGRGTLIGPVIVAIGVVVAAIAFAVVTVLIDTADGGTDLRLQRLEETVARMETATDEDRARIEALTQDLTRLREDMSLLANRAPVQTVDPSGEVEQEVITTDPAALLPDEDFENPATEDLTEQTFLQAYRHFARAQRESNGRPLRPWLIRIAHNLAANYYRDRSRRPQTQLEDAAVVSAPHDTEDLVEGRQELQQVLEGVSRLPDDRREALIMRFALGMDNREIARALDRSEGATKVLIHRAIKQLEQGLKEEAGDE